MKVKDKRAREMIMTLVDKGHARLSHLDSHDHGDDIGVLVHLMEGFMVRRVGHGQDHSRGPST